MAHCQPGLNLLHRSPSQITFLLLRPPLSSCLRYLISPHALPLRAPCHPHFPFTRPPPVDLILISPAVLRPRPQSHHWPLHGSTGHSDHVLTSNPSSGFRDVSFQRGGSVSDVSLAASGSHKMPNVSLERRSAWLNT